MVKTLVFLLSPLLTAGLVVAFGWPILVICFALALGTLLFSNGNPAAELPEGLGGTINYDTSALARL